MQRARKERAVAACLAEVLARKRRLHKLVRALVLARVLTSLSLRYRPAATDLESAVSRRESQVVTRNAGDLRTAADCEIGGKVSTGSHISAESDEWPILLYGCVFFCLLLVLVIPLCH